MNAQMKSELQIPWATLLKLAAFALLVAAVIHLAPLLLLALMALIIAVALDPALVWLDRYLPRTWGAGILMLGLVTLTATMIFWIGPPLMTQFNRVVEKAPTAGTSLLSHLPPRGIAHKLAEKTLAMPGLNFETVGPRLLSFGQMAIGALASLVIMAALVGYLLVDGRGAHRWVVSFFKPETQEKLNQTAAEITPVVSAYIVGQFITSVLCSVFVFGMLKAFNVPAALLLAVVAGVFDVLPIIGFFLSAIPSVLFALTVSPSTAGAVFVIYLIYHAVENYLIVPVVYGNRLRLSGLVVLIAILAGASLGGILGAIIVLPIVASYPIVEKIWLGKYVGRQTVIAHRRQQALTSTRPLEHTT